MTVTATKVVHVLFTFMCQPQNNYQEPCSSHKDHQGKLYCGGEHKVQNCQRYSETTNHNSGYVPHEFTLKIAEYNVNGDCQVRKDLRIKIEGFC
jgi:hypothetical protein